MTGFFNPFASGAGGGGGADYNNLTNKPTINGVTVQGSLTAGDLLITAADVGALPSGTKYGADFALSIDSQTFVVTAQLKDQDGNNLGQAKTIDLPLETMVVGGSYDDTTQKVILTLKNGQTVEFSVADLISGLQSEITLSNKLDADLVDDVSSENKFVTAAEKTAWNAKANASDVYTKSQTDTAIETAIGTLDVKDVYVGVCSSLAATAAKVVTVDNDFVLKKGVVIAVKFDYTNSVRDAEGNPITLNVNNTGAYRIWYRNGEYANAVQGKIFGLSGYYIFYIFDGTNRWIWLNYSMDNTYALLTQSEASEGTATTEHLINAKVLHDTIVKQINDLDVSSVGGSGKYISAISEEDGKIEATPTNFDTSLSSSSTDNNAPTSKAVYDDQQRQEIEIGVVANAGAKNFFNINATPIINHTTYTFTDEKLTVSADGSWAHYSVPIDLPAGDYILSMLISDYNKASDAPNDSMRLRISATTSGGTTIASPTITGNGIMSVPFTWSGGIVYIQFYSNYNATSYANSFSAAAVMIRRAEITDSTFVPYAKTNHELTIAEAEDRAALVGLVDEISQLKNYIGYERSQILGLQADYQNKIFTRLGKAVDLNSGSDFNQFNIYNKRRRCNVSDDGTINAFYGESGYIEDGTNGQVMVYQPKFYYKVEPLKLEPIVDGEGYHIRKANYYISETPRDGFKLHPAFKDENGNELEYYLISAYEASLYDVSESTYILDDAQVADFSADKICSIVNAKPISGLTQNLTRSNCEKLAINRGTRWHNITIQIASAEQLLFMIEYGKMNAQEAIGKGVVNKASGEGNESINTGSTSNLGNASGAASGTDGLVSITYRGVENLWGNIWSWIDGVNIWGDGTKKGGIPYITNKLPFVENTKTDYNSAGFTTSGTNGCISAMGYGNPDYDWVFFASETTGNSTLPVGDYQYYTANLNGYRVASLGGSWGIGLQVGLFCWLLHSSSSIRNRTVGGRGVIIPDINAINYWTNIRKAS